jgi:non-heme chloroperoxidase
MGHASLRRKIILGAAAAATLASGAVAYRRRVGAPHAPTGTDNATVDLAVSELGWGTMVQPTPSMVSTRDGARLAVWDIGEGPTVTLAHCWGCSHAVWIPVARRLVASGHRVVLYDQRGHGASTRGTAQLSIESLANDFAAVLKAREVADAVLVGHSMGGMTVMALAAYRPEVLAERGRALVLVATAAAELSAGIARADFLAARLIASPVVALALRSSNGHRFVRGAFGHEPVRAQMDLARTLFADCDPSVRSGFFASMNEMNLLESIAAIKLPTTVVIGSRDRLTAPARANLMVNTIPGARLVTVEGRGHMLPLEDPDAVTDEIVRAVKG